MWKIISGVAIACLMVSCNSTTEGVDNQKKIDTTVQVIVHETKVIHEHRNEAQSGMSEASDQYSSIKDEYAFLVGTWNGTLRNKEFKLAIQDIQGNKITGYNIVQNNKRPVSGTIMPDEREQEICGGELRSFKVILNEPGDDKWDGFFTLYFSDCLLSFEGGESHEYSCKGNWKAFSGKLSGDIFLGK